MKVMFLDESGDHSLTRTDPQYPIFVLGGIITEQKVAEEVITAAVRRFKLELFGRDDLYLHTADITRNRNGFERLQETSFRMRFYGALNELMASLDYKVVACAIRKDQHLARYGLAAVDPYMLSLDVLVERFCFEIGDKARGGLIVAEKRDPTLDHQLELAWLNLKIQGTRYLQATVIEQRVAGLVTRSKADRVAGLELADLVVSPIGRAVLGRQVKEDYRIIEAKMRRGWKGEHRGFGLVVLPKE
ncbi:MAG: DUF3800 domain-containing protein [Thermoanaerobaculaceae bacterium]